MTISHTPLYAHKPGIARCLWCDEILVDGGPEAGAPPGVVDYMTRDGDYGCDRSPDTDPEEGVGGHAPNEVVTHDGHRILIVEHVMLGHEHVW